jgi:ABC-2 type transport system ATP-binding protein
VSVIHAAQLRKAFGTTIALDGVDLAIQPGEFYGLLGPNGAGKTTLLRILCGLLQPDTGTLKISTPGNGTLPIGVVPQDIALYEMLTARGNLEVFGSLAGLRGSNLKERTQAVLHTVGLEDRANSKVKTFSGGMKRRLNLAVALLSDPPILLLDEPTVGVDPQSRSRIFSLLQDLHAAGKTLIYTTHYMEEAERLCKRIGIIDHGRLLAQGTLSELLSRVKAPRIVRFHGIPENRELPVLNHVQIVRENDRVDFIPDASADPGELLTQLTSGGLTYDRLEITGPTLETLFLELTGKELRN